MVDTRDLKEAIGFAVAFGMAMDEALADGWQATDVFKLIPATTKLPKAVEGAENIPRILAELDDPARQEIMAELRKLDLRDDDLEQVIIQSGRTVMEIGNLVALLRRALKKKAGVN